MNVWSIPRAACGLIVLTAGLCGAAAGTRAGESWPEFRGRDGQGHGGSAAVPVEFSPTDNVRWKCEIPGRGWSSPVIWENQIWLTTAVGSDESPTLQAICVERASGQIVRVVDVFQAAEPPRLNAKNSYASPTPVIEPGRVYVHFGRVGTAALDTATGQVLWRNTELKLDHKEGPGSSPISWGKLLIVHCDGTDVQYLAALDKATGQIAWKQTRSGAFDADPDFRKAYCTPLVIQTESGPLLVSVGADHVYGYDPASGQERWRMDYKGFSNVPRPVFGHGLIYFCTGYMKPELWALKPEGQGVRDSSEVVWRTSEQIPAISSPVLVGGEIFFVSNGGVATCLDALTGERLWRERLGGDFSASPVEIAGRLYFGNELGQVFVIEAAREFRLVATNQLDSGLMASPAVVDGALYLRTERQLYRIED